MPALPVRRQGVLDQGVGEQHEVRCRLGYVAMRHALPRACQYIYAANAAFSVAACSAWMYLQEQLDRLMVELRMPTGDTDKHCHDQLSRLLSLPASAFPTRMLRPLLTSSGRSLALCSLRLPHGHPAVQSAGCRSRIPVAIVVDHQALRQLPGCPQVRGPRRPPQMHRPLLPFGGPEVPRHELQAFWRPVCIVVSQLP